METLETGASGTSHTILVYDWLYDKCITSLAFLKSHILICFKNSISLETNF